MAAALAGCVGRNPSDPEGEPPGADPLLRTYTPAELDLLFNRSRGFNMSIEDVPKGWEGAIYEVVLDSERNLSAFQLSHWVLQATILQPERHFERTLDVCYNVWAGATRSLLQISDEESGPNVRVGGQEVRGSYGGPIGSTFGVDWEARDEVAPVGVGIPVILAVDDLDRIKELGNDLSMEVSAEGQEFYWRFVGFIHFDCLPELRDFSEGDYAQVCCVDETLLGPGPMLYSSATNLRHGMTFTDEGYVALFARSDYPRHVQLIGPNGAQWEERYDPILGSQSPPPMNTTFVEFFELASGDWEVSVPEFQGTQDSELWFAWMDVPSWAQHFMVTFGEQQNAPT